MTAPDTRLVTIKQLDSMARKEGKRMFTPVLLTRRWAMLVANQAVAVYMPITSQMEGI